MKRILLLCVISAASFFTGTTANAQFHASINIGIQPAWGPVGYDYAENYYLPDVEAYYNVPRQQFVYFDHGNWIYASSLPGRCGNYDLYSGYKVVMNERDPWCHFNDDRLQYANYRYRHDQAVIRDGRGYDGRGDGYGRGYDNRYDRDRGHDYGYNRNDDRRWERGRNDERRGGYDNDRRHDNDRYERRHDDDHGGRGRGRW